MIFFSSLIQFSSVAQPCPNLLDPMNHSTPGLPVHHQLPEFTHTHAHRFGDTIQPSHPLSSPSSPAPNPFQHQGLFQWVNSLPKVARVPTCYFWMFLFLQNLYFEILMPSVMVLGDRGFEKWSHCKGGAWSPPTVAHQFPSFLSQLAHKTRGQSRTPQRATAVTEER